MRRWRLPLLLCVIAVFVAADRMGWLLVPATNDLEAYDGRIARVVRIIDGDTLEVDLPDAYTDKSLTRVQVFGVRCPAFMQAGVGNEPGAQEAVEFTRSNALDTFVMLRLEPSRTRDSFGRLLAHVELNDGRNLARELLLAGLAFEDDTWPHRHLTWFHQAAVIAERFGHGVWAQAVTDAARNSASGSP